MIIGKGLVSQSRGNSLLSFYPEGVERAQNQLQTATRQLVALARRSVEGQAEIGAGDDTETEDELEVKEEPQVCIKPEHGADQEEKCTNMPEIAASTVAVGTEKMKSVDEAAPVTDSGATEVVESSAAASMRARAARLSIIFGKGGHRPDGREEVVGSRDELLSHYAFIVYAGFAENIMNKAKGTSIDADRVISSMTDKRIDDWRKMVHMHMLKVNRDFIKFLAKGNRSARSAKLFAGATSLAVSLMIRDKDQQFYLLKQVVEDLSHILDIARGSLLAAELSPIEKSRDDLYTYSYSTFQGLWRICLLT
ncbi:hypothetical protein PHYPSEUDO_003746 [Phytophthora pseudosyringae]|uniref:Uncharacterized protein n=1 Tax=Phytophthora pseudosyringae TaxID=221518 RepID=A0A8T1VQY6_9STRA|nr:hypothetical protein PHYPSEUDO_003746 [Phytophthora pseudosyringae]